MPAVNVQLKPYPSQVEAFGKLTNKMGLVPMRMIRAFAPYLKDDVAGFSPEQAATIFVRKEGVPVDEKGQEIKVDAPPPAEPKAVAPQLVEIPINWADLHHLQRTALAKKLVGESKKTLNVEE